MSKKGSQILQEALSLPPDERAEVVDRLLTSLGSPPDSEIEQLWAKEAEDRLDAFEQGEIKTFSAKRVFDAAGKPKR